MAELVGRVELSPEELGAVARRAAELVLEELAVERAPASPFFSLEEACEFMRCKPQRIYDLRLRGELTKFNDGSRVLVSREEAVAHVSPTGAGSLIGSGVRQ